MPSLLEDFYSQDDVVYYYEEEDDDVVYYYEEDDDDVVYYYEEDDDDVVYYYEEEDDDVVYYYEEEVNEPEQNIFYKKEINIAPKTINTPRDDQGAAWDAHSYEMDKDISELADEEGVDYTTAYQMFAQRYDSFTPDLTEYV